MDPKEFDMPVASFNPNSMKMGLFTDGLADMPFEQMLDTGLKWVLKSWSLAQAVIPVHCIWI